MRIRTLLMVITLMFQVCTLAHAQADIAGAVYTATNSAAGNAVIILNRYADGTLSFGGTVATGGQGTGAGLGNQGGVTLSEDNRWLFVVNAGSNTISVFAVDRDGLTLVDTAPSGGVGPVSVTAYKDLVYVLNAGSDNISGLRLSAKGSLETISGSSRPLSAVGVGAAQVLFNAAGNGLLVTERLTNRIDAYTVNSAGVAQGPTVYASSGTTPFGFAFGKRDQTFVSEAFGGAANGSAVSSYTFSSDAVLSVISGSVPTTETAACWLVTSNDGRFAYAANAGSASISGYIIDFGGRLQLLNADGKTGNTIGGNPTDMAMSQNGRYLYAVQGAAGRIAAFAVHADGSLEAIPGFGGNPAGVNGIAAR